MNGKHAGLIGMAFGIAGFVATGPINGFTNMLLGCGSFLLGVGIIAVAISTRGAGSGDSAD